MNKISTLSNHKGGKKVSLDDKPLGALHKRGRRVLRIDLDPQVNLTQSLRITGYGLAVGGR